MAKTPKPSLLKALQDKGANLAEGFYERGARLVRKLDGLLKISSSFGRLAQKLSKRPQILGIELFVALSLTVAFFYLIRPTVRMAANGDSTSKALFTYLSHKADPDDKQYIQLNWQKRLAGPMISGWLLDAQGISDFKGPRFEKLFGLYNVTWLFFLFLTLIVYRRDALLLMLVIMAGLMYYLSEPGDPQFYPWDLPTMFFFTLACLLYSNRRMGSLMVVIWVGALFKETTLCCALLILFGEHWSIGKRLLGFATTVIVTLVSYKLLMGHYQMVAHVFAMNQATSVHDLFWKSVMVNNVHKLFGLDPRHVIFANAGGLLLMLLLPWKNRHEVVLKILILVYVVGEFFWGIIDEFRIWYEVLPLGWMIISDNLLIEPPAAPAITAANKKTSHVLKGSYWLTLTALLAAAAAICLMTTVTPPSASDDMVNHMTMSELMMAAAQGNVDAEYRLGNAYQDGTGIEKDLNLATIWFHRAAEKGNVNAQNEFGRVLFDHEDYSNAQLWFSRAAAAGNGRAEYNLAILYHQGLGVEKNDAASLQWAQKAAAHGQLLAQKDLGAMYASGVGLKQDYVMAYQWLKLAQLQGDGPAAEQLKIISASMTPEQISEAEQLVQKFKAGSK